MSTAARTCRSVGLNLRTTEPGAVPVRYEKEPPGELLHVDIKRLRRFDRAGTPDHPQALVRVEE